MTSKTNFHKFLTILTTLALTYSLNVIYSQDLSSYVRLSGEITNPNSDKITIRGNGYIKVIDVNTNGTFDDTLVIKEGNFTFYDTKESTAMYLAPGYRLDISLDGKEFDETLKYSGIGEKPNNFNASYFLFNEKNAIDSETYKKMENQEYFDYELKTHASLMKLLNESEIENEKFLESQADKFRFQMLNNLITKLGEDYFAGKTKGIITQYLDSEIDKIDFKDSVLFASNNDYRYFLSSYFVAGLTSGDLKTLELYNEELLEMQKKSIVTTLKRGISFYNMDKLDLYYQTYVKLAANDKGINRIKEKYDRIKNLKKGSPSPSFNYPDSSGKNISLESLKGKLVYVDVWATWCGPCKAQIPFLKQLEEKYREEDIAFVSLSIDQLKNISKWKDMIVDKELEGIQIIADKAWRSKFVTDYVIEGIPRFILIDKDGNLMDPMAPRPAVYKEGEMQLNEEIQKIFDENI
ncbi:MAG: Thiol-disulfide oxidoreductase ResA [Crocinitomicaceae bacterium]|nr:MAG: Thiol-disulfide oxidoreductase ResA [Crocinitomicaceae bacterium]